MPIGLMKQYLNSDAGSLSTLRWEDEAVKDNCGVSSEGDNLILFWLRVYGNMAIIASALHPDDLCFLLTAVQSRSKCLPVILADELFCFSQNFT